MLEADAVKLAEQDFRDKVQLEKRLVRLLKNLNAKIVKRYAQDLGSFGISTDVLELFGTELTQVLLIYYNSVGEVFSDKIGATLPSSVAKTSQEQEQIVEAIRIFYAARAAEQSRIILGTSQKTLDDSAESANDIADGQPGMRMSKEEVAVTASAMAARLLDARVGTVAATETQVAAETAKSVEASVLAGATPQTQAQSGSDTGVAKQWVTVRDTKVRHPPGSDFDHVAADGQIVGINETYIVSGEALLWPGDMDLGASLGNTINCRCSSVHDTDQIISVRENAGGPLLLRDTDEDDEVDI